MNRTRISVTVKPWPGRPGNSTSCAAKACRKSAGSGGLCFWHRASVGIATEFSSWPDGRKEGMSLTDPAAVAAKACIRG